MTQASGTTTIVYVGTYTQKLPHVQGNADGIDIYEFQRESGTLQHLGTAPEVVNPSFLVLDAQRRYLYAVQEVGEHEGQPGGLVSAFAIDPQTHALRPINDQSTHGAFPCYVSIDESGRWLLVANHGGGNVCALPIAEDGSLGPATSVMQHLGPDGKTAHPHAIIATPDNHCVLVPDAGLDQIRVYRLDTERGTLTPNDIPWATLAAGTGPRHLAFHPGGSYVYSINESGSSVTAFEYDTDQGVLLEIETMSTLPDGFTGRNACADIHIDQSGTFLYGTNRGHNSIAIFALDAATGRLQAAGHIPTDGRTPRNFGLDPSGDFLLAANQDTDTVVTFAVDQETGALSRIASTPVATPVCLAIIDVET